MSSIFHDSDTTAAQRQGRRVDIGPWVVRLPRVFGFCGGVLHALKMLQATVEGRGTRAVWLLGEIIHNDTVNEHFREQGVCVLAEGDIETIFTRARPDDVIVIPAFGIPADLDARLRDFCRSPDGVVDTTCRYVRRIWEFVAQASTQQRTVIVHGKPDHPETRATLSRALTPANAVILVPDLAGAHRVAEALRERTDRNLEHGVVGNRAQLVFDRVALVNQTTMLYQETREIEQLLRESVESQGGSLVTTETLCRATQDRQNAALELCREGADVVLVVGGYSSSNTTQLHRLAKAYGPAYFVRNASALTRDRIVHYLPDHKAETTTSGWLPAEARTIGLLAGASCPPGDIGDVIRRLRALAG